MSDRRARRRAPAAHFPALAALTMLAWSAPAHAAPTTLLAPMCGGGFHPIDLPGDGQERGPDCAKACHAWSGRKSQGTKSR